MQIHGVIHPVPFSAMQGPGAEEGGKNISAQNAQDTMTGRGSQVSASMGKKSESPAGMVTDLRGLPGEHPAAWQQRAQSNQGGDGEVTAESCYRPLSSMPVIIGVRGSMADRDNNIIGHEHIFFSDGTDIGYGSNGLMTSEDKSEYSMCVPLNVNKQQVMDNVNKMADQFEAVDYRLLKHNCQDFVDMVTRWVN